MVMTFEQLQEIVIRTSVTVDNLGVTVGELTESQKETRASIAELTESH
jgi:hypothetical protein